MFNKAHPIATSDGGNYSVHSRLMAHALPRRAVQRLVRRARQIFCIALTALVTKLLHTIQTICIYYNKVASNPLTRWWTCIILLEITVLKEYIKPIEK